MHTTIAKQKTLRHRSALQNRRALRGTSSPDLTKALAPFLSPPVKKSAPELSPLALILILVAAFMVVLDFSIVNVALPSIHRALGFGGDSVQWVVSAYAIAFGGLLILGGRIADTFGRRRLFVVGILIFAVSSLAAGLTSDAILLVIARALQGVGAAIVAPAALSLITTNFAEGPRRTRALGFYGTTASIGFIAGQVLGGALVQYTSWRWIFLVNVPVGLVAAFLAPRLLTPDHPEVRRVRLDVLGGALVTLAVAAGVFAISEAPLVGWTQPSIFAALATAVVAFASFIRVERAHQSPLINFSLMRRPSLRTAAILSGLLGAWSAGELVVMSIYLQQSLHDSPVVAGLVIAPQGAVGIITGLYGARLVRHLGMRTMLLLAASAVTVGFLVLMHLPATGHYSPLFFAVMLVGFGTVGTAFGTTVLAASGQAAADQGLVGGVINTTRQVGAAVGVATLIAISEGAHAHTGTATISGDRIALSVAALVGLIALVVAWSGPRPSTLRPSSSAASDLTSAVPLEI
jgi:EmrB/QacA subfamily drug resistance transporter